MNASWLAGVRRYAGRYERHLWIGVFAVVLLIQWPVLKGYYYRAIGAPAPVSTVEWRTDLDDALAEARQTGKPILVDFSADWCPPCVAMKHDVWPNPGVERALKRSYIPLLIDVDRNGEVADRYGVGGIPTVLVLDAEGRVLRRATFLTARAMVDFLDASN